MQMIAVVPVIRAASATPWAWLPEEKATTPRARSPGESVRSLLSAPRILNAPARWSPSHLKNTRYPLASSNDCDATTGVRWMRPARRRAAALTVSSVSEAAADTTAAIIYSSHDDAPRPAPACRHAGRRRLGRLLRGPRRRHDRGPPDLGDGLDRRHHVQPERRGAHAEGRPVRGRDQIRRAQGHGKPVPDAHRRGAKDLPGGHRRSVRAVRCEAGGGP